MRSETHNYGKYSSRYSTVRVLLLGLMALAGSAGNVIAAELSLAWDPVSYNEPIVYEVHYGDGPRQYDSSLATSETSATIPNLAMDTTYHAAVRACTTDRSQCSGFSGEVSHTLASAPVVNFTANRTSGEAPLTVSLSAVTSGMIDTLNWQFGDAANSTDNGGSNNTTTQFTYTQPGTYSVTLYASGPGGNTQEQKTGFITVSEASVPSGGDEASDNNGDEASDNNQDIAFATNDLIVDFGDRHGVWMYTNNNAWTHLHGQTGQRVATIDFDGDGFDEPIIDFGPGYGIWAWFRNGDWLHVHGLHAEELAIADIDNNGIDDLLVDFGSSLGTWRLMNMREWAPFHGQSVEDMLIADFDGDNRDDIALTFATDYISGTYVWSKGKWTKLHDLVADSMVAADINGDGRDDLLATFASQDGTWYTIDQNEWKPFHGLKSTAMTGGDFDGDGRGDVSIAFQGWGTFIWNAGAWLHVNENTTKHLVAADIDADGTDDLVADFGDDYGIWMLMNAEYWVQLHSRSAEEIAVGNVR